MGKFKKGRIPWNKGDKVKLICKQCKQVYLVHPYRKESKYCSLACYQSSGDIKLYGRGENHPQWRGGRQKMGLGYIQIYMPEHPNADKRGRILEHRLVMERTLGRKLNKGEIVHHKNGVRGDNRPENLKLYESNGKHLSDEMKRIAKRENWNK